MAKLTEASDSLKTQEGQQKKLPQPGSTNKRILELEAEVIRLRRERRRLYTEQQRNSVAAINGFMLL